MPAWSQISAWLSVPLVLCIIRSYYCATGTKIYYRNNPVWGRLILSHWFRGHPPIRAERHGGAAQSVAAGAQQGKDQEAESSRNWRQSIRVPQHPCSLKAPQIAPTPGEQVLKTWEDHFRFKLRKPFLKHTVLPLPIAPRQHHPFYLMATLPRGH